MSIDLNDLNFEKNAEIGADLELDHPVTGDPTGIVIRLAGTDSVAYRRKQREIQTKRIGQLARGKKADYSCTEQDACDLLAACTLGWEGLIEGGEPVEFSTQAASDLYARHAWIREQVDMFVGDRANFFKTA